MSEAELARVRDRVAHLSPRLRGSVAVAAGRSAAADIVLDRHAGSQPVNPDDLSTVGAGWITFGLAHVALVIIPGVTHLSGRGSRLEPETGATAAIVSMVIAVVMSFVAFRSFPRMPVAMRKATRIAFQVGWIVAPLGFGAGLLRLILGETSEVGLMVSAAVVQIVGAVTLFWLWRRTPGFADFHGTSALSDAECRALCDQNPDAAQRMKDAEIQAMLALTALGQIDMRLAEAESARIDERWGESGESSPST